MTVSFTASWPEVERETTMANPRASHALLITIALIVCV
jgi:hypothetical protein